MPSSSRPRPAGSGRSNRSAVQRPPTPTQSTHADEQWNPTSTDLAQALPDMVAMMSSDGFTVRRVMYNPVDWDAHTPRSVRHGGGVIKLGAFNYQQAGTVTVVEDDGRNRVTLLLPAGEA